MSGDELAASRSASAKASGPQVPYPFASAKQMLEMAKASGLSIAAMKRANEETIMGREALDAGLDRVWAAMDSCIARGVSRDGIMPGGLKVKRRAKAIFEQLNASWGTNVPNPLLANDWLSVYAMAVNEENASGGRIVTAPTNGAAGVLPAVVKYYLRFHDANDREGIRNFSAYGCGNRRPSQAQCIDFRARSRLPGRGRVSGGNGCGRTGGRTRRHAGAD